MKEGTRLRATVLLVLIVVAVLSSLWAVLPDGDWKGLALNFGTEMAGAVVTYALLELFIGGRERREAKKADLIMQMGSSVKDVAVAAAEELRRHGWLEDGSLQSAKLTGANLQGAKLEDADLQGAILEGADLQRANLYMAYLQGAILKHASFDKKTTLPDGTMWTPDTDMGRFTGRGHPDFWRPISRR